MLDQKPGQMPVEVATVTRVGDASVFTVRVGEREAEETQPFAVPLTVYVVLTIGDKVVFAPVRVVVPPVQVNVDAPDADTVKAPPGQIAPEVDDTLIVV